ncbi:MAG TPA: class I SAM-dependent methyltransferase [Azospirillaceae bacterium]|nr:class I SAM-dependent methyltransferase [Azospirillaceae bacterium]
MTADGCVTEIGYTYGFHPETAPGAFALPLLLAGLAPPDLSGSFDYCELGFGQGFNLALLAAAWPRARFFGNDVNPAHVAAARGFAQSAGLANLSVSEKGFSEYAGEDLPAFDVIALHGVWSWVGRENRRAIAAFVRRHLKPGGLVYVSYNALPGWAPYMPLRALMKARVDRGTGPLADRIRDAVDFAQRLAAAGTGYMAAHPALPPRVAALAGRDVAYLAHEYFNDAWTPQYVAEAAAELAEAGLSFAAPARPGDRLDALAMAPEALALLAGEADPVGREGLRDWLTNQPFRRDLFVAGPIPLDPGEARRRLEALPFAALTPPHRLPGRGRLPQGEVALDRALCTGILAALERGPASAAALAGHAALAGAGVGGIADALVLLASLGHAVPAMGNGADPVRATSCRRFNAMVLERALEDDALGELASPVTSTGHALDRLERLFLLALQRGEEPAGFAWRALAARGQGVLRDGVPLRTEAENLEEIGDRLASFRAVRLPVLRRLGL